MDVTSVCLHEFRCLRYRHFNELCVYRGNLFARTLQAAVLFVLKMLINANSIFTQGGCVFSAYFFLRSQVPTKSVSSADYYELYTLNQSEFGGVFDGQHIYVLAVLPN
jgi:hypothetical protein